jgi:SRSO17 transposase
VEVGFQAKWQIALDQIDDLLADKLPRATVVADAGYGDTTPFREGLTERGLLYIIGVKPETTAWQPGQAPLPPQRRTGRGRPPTTLRRTAEHRPASLIKVARALPNAIWRQVHWREGTRGLMRSRFAAVRVRPAHRDERRSEPRPVEWLLIEWPRGETEPTKYWFSTLPEDTTTDDLVYLAKIRWRIERDYQEPKDEIGLDHYEGRGWRGFHHHGVLCICAYAFLAAERARLSPPDATSFLHVVPVPKGFRPRGAAAAS